jgi:hypothetical protein
VYKRNRLNYEAGFIIWQMILTYPAIVARPANSETNADSPELLKTIDRTNANLPPF